jgi:hypothetical protein
VVGDGATTAYCGVKEGIPTKAKIKYIFFRFIKQNHKKRKGKNSFSFYVLILF